MKCLNRNANLHSSDDLEQVLEPLADYICATERPRASLKLALAALISQIEQTNRSAAAQVAAFCEGRLAASV